MRKKIKVIFPVTPMFFNLDVSVAEELYQASCWKQSQKGSERRARNLIREWMQGGRPINKNTITPEMVQHAKESIIEDMIDVHRGIAQCISGEHEDKRPSMSVKNNHARCYSCGWHGDSIDVAMKVYGISFHDAVRRLTSPGQV